MENLNFKKGNMSLSVGKSKTEIDDEAIKSIAEGVVSGLKGGL